MPSGTNEYERTITAPPGVHPQISSAPQDTMLHGDLSSDTLLTPITPLSSITDVQMSKPNKSHNEERG